MADRQNRLSRPGFNLRSRMTKVARTSTRKALDLFVVGNSVLLLVRSQQLTWRTGRIRWCLCRYRLAARFSGEVSDSLTDNKDGTRSGCWLSSGRKGLASLARSALALAGLVLPGQNLFEGRLEARHSQAVVRHAGQSKPQFLRRGLTRGRGRGRDRSVHHPVLRGIQQRSRARPCGNVLRFMLRPDSGSGRRG